MKRATATTSAVIGKKLDSPVNQDAFQVCDHVGIGNLRTSVLHSGEDTAVLGASHTIDVWCYMCGEITCVSIGSE